MIQDWNDRFSDNIRNYGGYSIGKLFALLNDPEIISLAGGMPSPDIFLKDETRRASQKRLEEDFDRIFNYTPVKGEQDLLKACIDFVKRDNIKIKAENILITCSGQHALDILGRLLIDPGDAIILDRPTFGGAITAFQMQRPEFIGVDLEENGSNIFEIRARLKSLKKSGRKPKFIYVVPDFQNPSGITMCIEKRNALIELSNEYDVPVVEDSPYRDLRYVGETIPSLYDLDQKRGGGNVIGLYTFSKLYCPGVRVGFAIGPADVIAKMTNIKEGNVLNTPKYVQDLCTAFLTEMDYEAHIEKCCKYYSEKLNVFLDTMEETFPPDMGVTWTKPEGGLFLWVTVPEHIDTMDLFHEALKYKVAFVPGEACYGESPEKNHMRINFSFASKEQLAEAVKRLSGCIKSQL